MSFRPGLNFHIDLLEQEDVVILNYFILSFARKTVASYHKVLTQLNIKTDLYLTQVSDAETSKAYLEIV